MVHRCCRLTAMPGIALVLGAGGTVGHAFHAGVLAALAEVAAGMPARRTSSSARRPVRPSPPAPRRHAADRPAQAGRPAAASDEGAAIVRRAGLGPPRRARQAGVGVDGVDGRLARAARAPWQLTPGSLAAAVLPAGTVSTADLGVPFDNLYGEAWPSRPTWIVAVQLDSGRRVAFGQLGAPAARPMPCGPRARSRRTSSRP